MLTIIFTSFVRRLDMLLKALFLGWFVIMFIFICFIILRFIFYILVIQNSNYQMRNYWKNAKKES